jgi:chromosome segregation ATPase
MKDSAAAIVEKDRLIAQLREHLREEAEVVDDEDGTRSPRRNVFTRLNHSMEKDIANMRTLLPESTNNLEAARRERDEHARKQQELSQDYKHRQSLLKKQESTMGTQRKDIIALREDVNRLRDKYDEARDRLQEDAYGSLESVIEERESTILDLRSQNDRLNSELAGAELSTTAANDDRDRIQLHVNELTRTVQTAQRDRDETKAKLDRIRAAATAHKSELARLRSEALVSQQTEATSTATRETQIRSNQEQQRGMQPPAHLLNYSLASMGTPFRGRNDTPISGYDSRPPNYSYVGSLPGRD